MGRYGDAVWRGDVIAICIAVIGLIWFAWISGVLR